MTLKTLSDSSQEDCLPCEIQERLDLMGEVAHREMINQRPLPISEVEVISQGAAAWIRERGYTELTPALFRAMDNAGLFPKRASGN